YRNHPPTSYIHPLSLHDALPIYNFNMPLKKTLVVNPSNPLVQNAMKLWEKEGKKDLAKDICYYVQDLATLSGQGLNGEEKEKFRSEEHTSELQSRENLVCRLLLE